MRHTTIEILSTPACAACVATKVELTQAGIDFREVRAAVDPVAAADLMARYADANGGAGTAAPLVLVSDESGKVIDHWAGRPGAVVERITAIAA